MSTTPGETPYWIDPCHGMVGGPAVIGPTGIVGFMQGRTEDLKAEDLCRRLNAAWKELGSTVEFLRGERKKVEAERNGIISRLRARWPHIEIPTNGPTARTPSPRVARGGLVADPGSPACLRCAIEDEIGPPWHDGLGRPRGEAKAEGR